MKYSSFLIPKIPRLVLILTFLVMLWVLTVPVVSAQAPPTPPSRFVGSVLINGEQAPMGTTVLAQIDGVICGSGAINTAGKYVLDIEASESCGSLGVIITFQVNGIQVKESGTWKNDQLSVLDLTVTTSQGVVVPLAPNTGSGLESDLSSFSFVMRGFVLFVASSLFVVFWTTRQRELHNRTK